MKTIQQIKTIFEAPGISAAAAIVIVLVFAIAGGKQGLYDKVMPVLVIIAAPVIGLFAIDKVNLIADSRLCTFAACTAAAWMVLIVIKKAGKLVSDWFVLGWLNKAGGFAAGLLEGLLVVMILRLFI